MSRQNGTLRMSSNIEPRVSAPLDARAVCDVKADLTTPSAFPYYYVGMRVSVKAEQSLYMLIGSDPTDINNWKKVDDSSSGKEMTFDEIKELWDQVFNGG